MLRGLCNFDTMRKLSGIMAGVEARSDLEKLSELEVGRDGVSALFFCPRDRPANMLLHATKDTRFTTNF